LGMTLPPEGEYGVGAVFLPRDMAARSTIEALMEKIIQEEGQTLLGWRDLPTDDRLVGASAAAVEPYFKQIFIGAPEKRVREPFSPVAARDALERKHSLLRKRIEPAVDRLPIPAAEKRYFYIPSLSA